jgi:ribosome maturation factor RimP
MVEQKIIDLIEKKCLEPDFQTCFLIDVNLHGKFLEVIMDADTGIQLGQCQKLSRYLESELDVNLWLGEEYTLEVSSPGVERPLKFARQYPRNVGRSIEVKYGADAVVKLGILKSATPEQIVVEETVKRKEGRKNITEKIDIAIPFDSIQKAVIQLIF